MIVAALLDERGHARLLALDCTPTPGGVQAARVIAAADLPAGEYAGEQIESEQHRTPVTVRLLEPLEGLSLYRDVFLEVTPCR